MLHGVFSGSKYVVGKGSHVAAILAAWEIATFARSASRSTSHDKGKPNAEHFDLHGRINLNPIYMLQFENQLCASLGISKARGARLVNNTQFDFVGRKPLVLTGHEVHLERQTQHV